MKSTTEKTVATILRDLKDIRIEAEQLVEQRDELLAALKYGAEHNGLFRSECKEVIAKARLSNTAGKASSQPTLAERK